MSWLQQKPLFEKPVRTKCKYVQDIISSFLKVASSIFVLCGGAFCYSKSELSNSYIDAVLRKLASLLQKTVDGLLPSLQGGTYLGSYISVTLYLYLHAFKFLDWQKLEQVKGTYSILQHFSLEPPACQPSGQRE